MRLSIRTRIFLAFVLVQIFSAVLTFGWYFYTVNADLRALSRANAEETVLRAVAATKDYFGPPEAIARITQSLLAGGVLERTRPDRLERFFLEQLRRAPYVAGLFVGYPDGAFYYVSRNDEGPAGSTRTKLILEQPGGRTVNLTWRDADFNTVRIASDPTDAFDPRTRTWYQAAEQRRDLIWTDPYIFFTARKPGITAAMPVIAADGKIEAVVGLDIEISAVSRFLVQIGFRSGGSAYILSPEGDVVAHGRDRLVIAEGQGADATLRFRKAAELPGVDGAVGGQLMARAAQTPGADAPKVLEFEHDGQGYFVAAESIGDANFPWRVVSIVRAAGIMRTLHSANLLILGIVLLSTLVACVIGYVVATGVGRPLVELHRDAQLARHGNFEVMGEMSSGYREIDETQQVLRSLAKQVRGTPKTASEIKPP